MFTCQFFLAQPLIGHGKFKPSPFVHGVGSDNVIEVFRRLFKTPQIQEYDSSRQICHRQMPNLRKEFADGGKRLVQAAFSPLEINRFGLQRNR